MIRNLSLFSQCVIDGSIRLQGNDNVGAVNSAGTIIWTQPNDFFLTAGTIAGGTLIATGSTSNGLTTTYTRLDLKSGSGYSNADSLDEYFSVVNPRNPMSGFMRVLHDGSRFVALAFTGTISISTDGTNWQSRSTGSTMPLRDLAYGAGTWLAVGDANTLLSSTDLITWTSRASGIGALQNYGLTSAAFFNGKFYVTNMMWTVARSLTSTAATWETMTTAPALNTNFLRTLNGKLYYSGKTLYGSNGLLYYMDDGSEFTEITLPGGSYPTISSMAFGAGKVLMNTGASYFTSTDGTEFTKVTSPINFGFIGFDGSKFVGRGLSGTSAGFRYLTNAGTWTTGDADALTGVVDMASFGGTIVGVGAKGKKSTDGINWTNVTTSAVAPGGTGTVGDRIVYGNGVYILHGAAGSNYVTRDGMNWTAAPAKSALVFGSGVFVSTTAYSVNGTDWIPINYGLSLGETVTRIVFDGTQFLASTSQGRALVSAEGAT